MPNGENLVPDLENDGTLGGDLRCEVRGHVKVVTTDPQSIAEPCRELRKVSIVNDWRKRDRPPPSGRLGNAQQPSSGRSTSPFLWESFTTPSCVQASPFVDLAKSIRMIQHFFGAVQVEFVKEEKA